MEKEFVYEGGGGHDRWMAGCSSINFAPSI